MGLLLDKSRIKSMKNSIKSLLGVLGVVSWDSGGRLGRPWLLDKKSLLAFVFTGIAQSHIPQAILEVEQRRRNTKTSTLKTKSKPTSTNNKNYSPDTSTTTTPDETDDDEYTSDGTTTTNTYDE
jgi:cytoskeletal protein RodZ